MINVLDNIPHSAIMPSLVHGHGLFALNSLAAGTVLTRLDGQVMPWPAYHGDIRADEWNALAGGRLLLRTYRTKYYYINHSRTPNLKIAHEKPDILLLTVVVPVAAGEELFLDYRDEPLPADYLKGHGATYL